MGKRYRPPANVEKYREPLLAILHEVVQEPNLTAPRLIQILKQHPKDGRGLFKQERPDSRLPRWPERTACHLRRAGARPPAHEADPHHVGRDAVTVLTKPYPCPGECIFCPNDLRMPKSYLVNEPGAQRAPSRTTSIYLQAMSRLGTLYETGHPLDKVELIILGGTWSFYPETYQVWFVKRLFDALHDFGAGVDRTTKCAACCALPRNCILIR